MKRFSPVLTLWHNVAMSPSRMFQRTLSSGCLAVAALALLVGGARAQMPEERPMTPQEARKELQKFKSGFKNTYVHLIPRAQVRLRSGVIVTVDSAAVDHDRIRFTGTVRNASARTIKAGYWIFDLNESFEFQMAYFQREPVRIGACGGPCVSSNNTTHFYGKRLRPGESFAYEASSGDFSQSFPEAKASDVIALISAP